MSDRFVVRGEAKGHDAYYCGWWHAYGEPLLSASFDPCSVKLMSRANANRVRRRLEDRDIWGGKWRIEQAPGVKTARAGP